MNHIRILDCTLRDGGYINDWKFGKDIISGIISNLIDAHIDIIECGFIRDVECDPDSSVYSSMDQLSAAIAPKRKNVQYVVMLEQRNYRADLICDRSEKTADMIRLTFRQHEWENVKITAKGLMKKGYEVCIQPVGTTSYDDLSLISLIRQVNELKPYAFYFVDTLGLMYSHEMRKFFYLIDHNLSPSIRLGFHSHNNLQMSFANAQEMIRLNRGRTIIIDSSCYGMGRGVGNLATELIIEYINHNIEQRYSLTPVMNIIDQFLMPIYSHQRWGYDLPYFLSAAFKCHPDYATYLMRKETLSIEKIEKILSLIPNTDKNEYNDSLIESLYLKMQSCTFDDTENYQALQRELYHKDAVIIAPGSSIISFKDKIRSITEDKVVISANFIPKNFDIDIVFVSNDKRLGQINLCSVKKLVATSNLMHEISNAVFLDYASLLGEGEACDNAGAMLIRALSRIGIHKLFLAGFDGFDVDSSHNFAVSTFKKQLDSDTVKMINEDISRQLSSALSGVDYEFITPTKYEIRDI